MEHFFFFLAILNLQFGEMEFSRRLCLSGKLIYPFFSVVAVFMMLVRILNTLPSRIWDILFFLFSGYSKSTVGEKGIRQMVMDSRESLKDWRIFSGFFVFWDKIKRLVQRNKIKLIKILFSLETSMHFSRKILISGKTPYFSYTKILTSFVAKEQKTGNLI